MRGDMFKIVKRAIGKVQRAAAQRCNKTPLTLKEGYRCITFCFDDFPRTAGDIGARILEEHGARGTFYTCFGLLGTESPSGRLASKDQVASLVENGHEIGCHTYDHINCGYVSASSAAAACDENLKTAAANNMRLEHFAYPQGGMSLRVKAVIQSRFVTARSIIPGINMGTVDAHCLRSVPLYEHVPHEETFNQIKRVETNGGWLILYTHDIAKRPSQYGVTEKVFREIVAYSASKNLPIKTVGQALQMGRY
jgi:peptidoglycan/xylan/chitin deacetylase (PgdA/CDA1 family)